MPCIVGSHISVYDGCIYHILYVCIHQLLSRSMYTLTLVTQLVAYCCCIYSHVVIVSPPLRVLGPFYELQVPFYRDTYAHIKGVSKMYVLI